jgi:hypothetical protein
MCLVAFFLCTILISFLYSSVETFFLLFVDLEKVVLYLLQTFTFICNRCFRFSSCLFAWNFLTVFLPLTYVSVHSHLSAFFQMAFGFYVIFRRSFPG